MTACTDDEDKPSGISDEPETGGTVQVLTRADGFGTMDPQRIYVVSELNASKLMTRTLTTYKAAPGEEGTELVGDLATDTGRPNGDHTVWEYTLRDGVKWQNGDPVTCEDVRYGTLRNFDVRNGDDAEITGGPPWALRWLDVPDDYTGPRTDADATGDIDGVNCVDEKTVEFRLKEPVLDFPYAVSMTGFAPVAEEFDTWEDYGTAPLSTGPYKLVDYSEGDGEKGEEGKAVFERNKHWDAATDSVRRAAPDKIEYVFGVDPEKAAQKIVSGDPEYDNAVMYDDVPANSVQQVVNDDELMAQTVNGESSTVIYLAINTETVADVECRQALTYAFNKRKYRDVLGGATAGEYATTMITPDDPGYKDFDVYGLGSNPEGDLESAQELLDEHGDCPDELTLDVQDVPRSLELADTIVETYARIGVTVKLNKHDASSYYDEIATPANQHDLVFAGWIPDWPGGSSVIPPLFDGDAIVDGINNNYSLLDDPEVNDRIQAADAEEDMDKAYQMWGDLDEDVQELAATVPIMYDKTLSLCGKNIRGAFLNAQWGGVDVASLGLADPSG
ncbi:MAG: ABC transporter substrate-binding protein [Stackebrandtia sp.]